MSKSFEELFEQSQIDFEEINSLGIIYPKRKKVSEKAVVVRSENAAGKEIIPNDDWFDKLLSQDMDEWNGKSKEQTILKLAAQRQEKLFAYLENQQRLESLMLRK